MKMKKEHDHHLPNVERDLLAINPKGSMKKENHVAKERKEHDHHLPNVERDLLAISPKTILVKTLIRKEKTLHFPIEQIITKHLSS
jgi:hypothetical protein